MRGVETRIQEIRHAIFTEVAKMAYDVDSPVEKTIEEIPYRVIPGEVGNFRNGTSVQKRGRARPDLGQYQTGGPGGDVLYTAAH